jgi:hypothetical protein
MEVMTTSAKARFHPRWVESRIPGAPRNGLHAWLENRQEVR